MPHASARAEAKASEPVGYREAIARALDEYGLGHLEEAREQFARAHAILPNARTFRGLGMTEFELRNYVESEHYLREALASEDRPLEGAMRRDAQALLTRATGYVGELSLYVSPATTTLVIDGIKTLHPVPSSLHLDVGDHVLDFRAEGYANERRIVKVMGTQAGTLEIVLSELVADEPAHAAHPPAASAPAAESAVPKERARAAQESTRPDDRASASAPLYTRWWLWTAVAVVAAGAATGAALLLTAKRGTVYDAVPTDNTPRGLSLMPLGKR